MKDFLQKQIAYFARINHSERFLWQTSDAFVMEHEHATLRPFVEEIKKIILQKGKIKILESGSGEGVNFIHIKQMGIDFEKVDIEGIDPCAEAVEVANQYGLNCTVADGLALPYPAETFDIVFCRDVLHHLANDDERKKFLSEMTRVTKLAGCIVAIEPSPGNPLIFVQSCVLWAERGLRAMKSSHVLRWKSGARVIEEAPSASWRVLWHYTSPLRRYPQFSKVILQILRAWEIVCRNLPKYFWSYRIYIWKKES